MLAARAPHSHSDESLSLPQIAVSRGSNEGSQVFQKCICPVSGENRISDRGVTACQVPQRLIPERIR